MRNVYLSLIVGPFLVVNIIHVWWLREIRRFMNEKKREVVLRLEEEEVKKETSFKYLGRMVNGLGDK